MQQLVPVLVVIEDAAGMHADPLLRHEDGAAGRPLAQRVWSVRSHPRGPCGSNDSRRGLV